MDPTPASCRAGESEQRLVKRAFAAFGRRTRPAAAFVASWPGRPGLEGTPDEILGSVPRDDIDDALLDSVCVHATDIAEFATVEGCLYYLPVMIARCLRDPEGADLLPRALLSQVRRRPYQLAVAQWPRLIDAAVGDKPAPADPKSGRAAELGRDYVLKSIQHWLMVGDDWRRTAELLRRMTDAERGALAAFFDHLAAVGRLASADVSVAKALLARRGVMEVLSLRTHAESTELLGVLSQLETRHPTHFPRAELAPVKSALLDIVPAGDGLNGRGGAPRGGREGRIPWARPNSTDRPHVRRFRVAQETRGDLRHMGTTFPRTNCSRASPRGRSPASCWTSLFAARTDILSYATAAGRLYCLPLVVALCVRGDRGDLLQDTIVWQFRHCPCQGDPVAKLPLLVDAATRDESRFGSMRSWLMMTVPECGDLWTWQQTLGLVSAMTAAEREALVAFFDYRLGYAEPEADEPSVASARALLAGRGVMEVLRIRTHSECMDTVAVLEELTARYPAEFPAAEAAPLKNALLDIAAGRRSPDETLGW